MRSGYTTRVQCPQVYPKGLTVILCTTLPDRQRLIYLWYKSVVAQPLTQARWGIIFISTGE